MTRVTSHFNNNPPPEQEQKGGWLWTIAIIVLFWGGVLEAFEIINVLL